MTTYNTGNPIGSKDPRDLYDNAENLDVAVNDPSRYTWSDRLGRSRKTMSGMEREFNADQDDRGARFNAFIASSGYQFLGDYAAGIEITEYNQIVRDADGEFWRVSGQVDLPYTTTGAGLPEDDAMTPLGDAVLRQELANPDNGAALVGFKQEGVSTNVHTALSALLFKNIEEMRSAIDLKVGMKARTLGYYTPGDGGGCDYEIVTAGTGANFGFLYEQLTASGFEAKLLGGGIMEDKTVYIPSDYPTLQDSFNELGNFKIPNNGKIIHLIESGHKLTHSLRLDNGDYRNHIVSSEDSVVPVSEEFHTVSTLDLSTDSLPRNANNAFVFINTLAPEWGILVDMGGLNSHGMVLGLGSSIYVREGFGCINSGLTNLICYGSRASTPKGKYHSAGYRGIWVGNTGEIDGQGVEAYECGDNNIHISRGSRFNLQNAIAYGAGRNGADIRRSSGHIGGANFSSAIGNGIDARSSLFDASECVLDGCDTGALINNGSNVSLNGSSAQSCNIGVHNLRSFVSANIVDATDSNVGFRCSTGVLIIKDSIGSLWAGNVINETNSNGTVFR